MKKKIYISIPISGRDISAQRHKADLVKARLSRDGYEAVTPFEIYCGKNPAYEDYIVADLRVLMTCDAAYFCEGWEESVGCRIEKAVAEIYSKRKKRPIKLIFE